MGQKKTKPKINLDIADSELQMRRLISWNAYNDFLKETDSSLLIQFQKTTRQLQIAFWLNIIMSGTIFLFGLGLLVFGIRLLVSESDQSMYVGVGLSILSTLAIFVVLYRSPINNIRNSASNLAKINIILMGYVRQLNQIDMAYKQVLFSSSLVDPREIKETVQSIQEVVEQSVDEVIRSLEGLI